MIIGGFGTREHFRLNLDEIDSPKGIPSSPFKITIGFPIVGRSSSKNYSFHASCNQLLSLKYIDLLKKIARSKTRTKFPAYKFKFKLDLTIAGRFRIASYNHGLRLKTYKTQSD